MAAAACLGVTWQTGEQPLDLAGAPLEVRLASLPSGCPYVLAIQTDGVESPTGFASELHLQPPPLAAERRVHRVSSRRLVRSSAGWGVDSGECRDSALLLFLRVPAGTRVEVHTAGAVLHEGPLFDDLLIRNGQTVAREFFGEDAAVAALTMPSVPPPYPRALVPWGGGFRLTRRGWLDRLGNGLTGESVRLTGAGKVIPVRVRIGEDGAVTLASLSDDAPVSRFALAPHRPPLLWEGRPVAAETVAPFYLDANGVALPWPLAARYCRACVKGSALPTLAGSVTVSVR